MGTIVLAKLLDAEKQSHYNFTVQVTDGTNTATTQVGYVMAVSLLTYVFFFYLH